MDKEELRVALPGSKLIAALRPSSIALLSDGVVIAYAQYDYLRDNWLGAILGVDNDGQFFLSNNRFDFVATAMRQWREHKLNGDFDAQRNGKPRTDRVDRSNVR